jgi:hypothetical protein
MLTGLQWRAGCRLGASTTMNWKLATQPVEHHLAKALVMLIIVCMIHVARL